MDNKPIQLTEQDIHMLVEDAVKNYLIQEGLWGGLKNLGQKAGQAVGNRMNKMGTAIGNQVQKASNAIGNQAQKVGAYANNAYNNTKNAAGNAYNNMKTAYQQGSAQQDLQNVNKALQPMVQKGILGQTQYRTILGMLNKAMQAQGGQAMQGMA